MLLVEEFDFFGEAFVCFSALVLFLENTHFVTSCASWGKKIASHDTKRNFHYFFFFFFSKIEKNRKKKSKNLKV